MNGTVHALGRFRNNQIGTNKLRRAGFPFVSMPEGCRNILLNFLAAQFPISCADDEQVDAFTAQLGRNLMDDGLEVPLLTMGLHEDNLAEATCPEAAAQVADQRVHGGMTDRQRAEHRIALGVPMERGGAAAADGRRNHCRQTRPLGQLGAQILCDQRIGAQRKMVAMSFRRRSRNQNNASGIGNFFCLIQCQIFIAQRFCSFHGISRPF